MIAEDSTGWAPWLYLLASLWGSWFAYNALMPRTRGIFFSTWSFLSGWFTGDLAFHHIAWQALATLAFGALGAFEALPGQIGLGVTGVSWLALLWAQLRSHRATAVCEAALGDAFGEPAGADPLSSRQPAAGGDTSEFRRLALAIPTLPPEVERVKNVQFWRAGGMDLHLDVYRPRNAPTDRADRPVLLQIHGGGWVVESKDHQALPLMHRLASNGWVCVSLDYRLSPHATFPEHVIDSKRGLAWVKENIAEHGGDPNFIVLTGGSAGGHLSALAALTPNDPEYQPGFEHVDTTVQGCVPFYGVYDFTGATAEHDGQQTLLERYVMKGSRQEIPEAYHRASPIHRVGKHAPPFFVIHGDCDTLVPLAQAHTFVRRLREMSLAPVAFAELPGAQHAFEIFHTRRTSAVVRAVERFANTLHDRYREGLQEAKDVRPDGERPQLHVV
jgi:acetyl esterase/lipase